MPRRIARVTWAETGEPSRILFSDVVAVFRLWVRQWFLEEPSADNTGGN